MQPNLMLKYNAIMGSVDPLDRTFRCRLTFRNKKGWWNLFINVLNIVVVNSWLLYSEAHEKNNKLTYLEFC